MTTTHAAGFSDPVRADFRNFLYLVWQHLGLPDPTPAQYEIAYFLQHGYSTAEIIEEAKRQNRRDIIEAFRGVGKSWITAAFCLWRLYCDPVNEKILVVSASGVKAREFVSQVKSILATMELLADIRPRPDQRNMADRFDVNGASISQSPSIKAAGITGQITGSRATLIVADDIEIPENSKTEEGRQNLLRITNEFEAIIVPGGDIVYLGTPQTEESIYNRKITEQHYRCFCWPARYPKPDKRASYVLKLKDLDGKETGETVDILAAPLRERLDADPSLAWKATDPERFDDVELMRRESKGRAFFALQYMLDTSLSDAERYPLKAHDCIIMGVNTVKAPMTIQWGRDSDGKNILRDVPNYGFSGDYCIGPLFIDSEWRPYEGSVLFVDPSGRGKDETAWAVLKCLNGTFFAPTIGGFAGDSTTGMELVAKAAKLHNVAVVEIEPNFAPGIWIAAFQPILARIWPGQRGEPAGCTVRESEWAKGQKEARICDTLEPVLTQHRLVLDTSIAEDEVFMKQMTRITRERGALTHDDRIDALAGAVASLQSVMAQDVQQQAAAMKERELIEFLEADEEFLRGPVRRAVRTRRGADGKLYRRVVKDIEVYQS
jgi:hypothetical protein